MFEWINRFRSVTLPVPEEYTPWIEELMPLLKKYSAALKPIKLNRRENSDIRVLSNFLLLGMFDYYCSTKGLTYGQRRHLYLVCGSKIGFSHSSLTTAYDTADAPSYYIPDLEQYVVDALDSGYRAAQSYFEGDGMSSDYIIRIKFRQWKDNNYKPPKGLTRRTKSQASPAGTPQSGAH